LPKSAVTGNNPEQPSAITLMPLSHENLIGFSETPVTSAFRRAFLISGNFRAGDQFERKQASRSA
jgi:hypothetical protein